MGSALRWEYKTIMVPSMDNWLIADEGLAFEVATGKGHEEVTRKHSAFLDKTLGALGNEGWELVALWESEPSQLFQYSARWMTFKRLIE
jgi:hypothetical protein